MATGIVTHKTPYSGEDLDSLFLPLETTKRADVNIDSNGGVDISNRFEPIGDGTAISNTGIESGGVDIATLFRDINEPLIALNWSSTSGKVRTSAVETPPGTAYLTFYDNGDTVAGNSIVGAIEDPWCDLGTDNGDLFECWWHEESSTGVGSEWVSSPTEDTWLPLSSTRSWVLAGGQAFGLRQKVITLKIRRIEGSAGEVSKTVTFETENVI